jgi:hypothetical protein
MSNPLSIIALSIKLDYDYLELLKFDICETLETTLLENHDQINKQSTDLC